MALIELNLEKPALKRVESGEKQESESSSGLLGGHESSSSKSEQSSKQSESSKQSQSGSQQSQSGSQQSQSGSQQSDSGGTSTIKKYGRRMAILGGTAAGVAAARKIRQRQKSGGKQQDLDEDWQTAETSSTSGSSGTQSSGSGSSGSSGSSSSQ